MYESEIECDESEWTPENLQRLFSAMKNSISDRDSNAPYAKVVKTFNWATVAFPPFSASDCKKKCMEVFRKKKRSLTELIVDAERSLSNPMHESHMRGMCRQNAKTIYIKENYYKLREENPGMSVQELFSSIHRKFSQVSNEEKAKYKKKAHHVREEYFKSQSDLSRQCFQTANRMGEQDENEPSAAKTARQPVGQPETTRIAERAEHLQEMSETQKESRTHCTTKAIRFRGEPKFPARTDNLLFFKEKMNQLRKEIPGVQERFSKVCQMWADLSISQRNNYTEMCNAGKLKYQNELQHWFETLNPKLQAIYLKRNPCKRKYLHIIEANCQQQQEPSSCLPSDSEDEEDIVCSSDDNSDNLVEYEKDDEREEQEDSFIFEMY